MKELGYDIEFYLWVGMFAPKGTPDAVITTLREASRKAAADEKFVQAMKNLGQDVAYLDQAEFKAFWDADAKRVRGSGAPDRQGVRQSPAADVGRRWEQPVNLRRDHVAGGAFVVAGALVLCGERDLPFGTWRRLAPACCRSWSSA